MSDSAIAIRYAKALLNIAEEQKLIERFSDEVGQLAELLKKEDLLRLLLDSPTFPLEKKLAIMRDIGDKLQLSAGLQNFLDLLLQKGRIIYLGDIARNYRRLADDRSGVLRATIKTAHELPEPKAEAIKTGLEQQIGKKIILSIERDEALIGGILAEMGGKIFDGSVKTQLKRIADTLAKG
ncbi:ATP synthase F1 subunit delta [Pelobacter seleniigenes]|uniref:ATP synthase F1 subunit delta n=1 Tax=Pelobacter seleniigenes TaxID=407188 RepID=UPI0004A77612|nr:ATP synthase F1 subunit delta [Pelobacter seleniigenes]